MQESLSAVEFLKDSETFIAKVQSDLGGVREYRGASFEEVLEPWIGTPCETDADCSFAASGETGTCYTFAGGGFCTLRCEGYCPDRSGYAHTFCVQTTDPSEGMCVAKSEAENDSCGDVEGTSAQTAERYVGSSGASSTSAEVCLP